MFTRRLRVSSAILCAAGTTLFWPDELATDPSQMRLIELVFIQ